LRIVLRDGGVILVRGQNGGRVRWHGSSRRSVCRALLNGCPAGRERPGGWARLC